MQLAKNTYTTLKQCNTNKRKTLHNYIKKILSELKLDKSYKYHISDTKKLYNKIHVQPTFEHFAMPLQFNNLFNNINEKISSF